MQTTTGATDDATRTSHREDDRMRSLPKAHLHVHLDGSYPIDAVQRVAARRGVPFERPAGFADIAAFFAAYARVPALIETHDDLAELCRALVVAEAAQGVRYLEPAVEPQLHGARLGGTAQVLRTMLHAFAEAAADAVPFGASDGTRIEVGASLTMNTDVDADIADELAALAVEFAGRGVTAFGTACFDEHGDLRPFAPAARRASAAGLPIVSHAGQTGGPDQVTAVLDVLGASRLSHGVRAIESPALVDRLVDEDIMCDVCPVSNVTLGVARSLDEHPGPRLLDAGVPITLNADDGLWFDTVVSDQYRIARDTWGMDAATLARVAANGVRATGMSQGTRDTMRADLAHWLAATL